MYAIHGTNLETFLSRVGRTKRRKNGGGMGGRDERAQE
jgi:hypothetical protein